jgi:hypothetical protein
MMRLLRVSEPQVDLQKEVDKAKPVVIMTRGRKDATPPGYWGFCKQDMRLYVSNKFRAEVLADVTEVLACKVCGTHCDWVFCIGEPDNKDAYVQAMKPFEGSCLLWTQDETLRLPGWDKVENELLMNGIEIIPSKL